MASFATHIIENGYSAQTLQGLLGHASPETSFNYIHCASPKMIKVKSPYDDL
ncbi:MAG: tyrosine-type recombinase/integrase [Nanoarchaeota archaeon]|nr:tyrosine-type recombinase/integrase [Nanoarchaeota archaeon]